MTPAQLRARNPDWPALSSIAGGIGVAVAALGALGFSVLNPREQVERLEVRVVQQGKRIDSLAIAITRVNALVTVKCIETTDAFIREVLECRR